MRIHQAFRRIQKIGFVRCNKKLTIICSSFILNPFFSQIFYIRNQQILKALSCFPRVLISFSICISRICGTYSSYLSANFWPKPKELDPKSTAKIGSNGQKSTHATDISETFYLKTLPALTSSLYRYTDFRPQNLSSSLGVFLPPGSRASQFLLGIKKSN